MQIGDGVYFLVYEGRVYGFWAYGWRTTSLTWFHVMVFWCFSRVTPEEAGDFGC